MQKKVIYILILCIVFNSIGVFAAEPGLKDISKHWAKSNIEYLYQLKYISGYPDNTYKPDNPVSVIEFLKLATLAAGYKLENGSKVWYEPYLAKALEKGLIAEGEYPDLNVPVTREQVAKIAVLACMLNEEAPAQDNDELIKANIVDYPKIIDDKKQYVIDAYNLGLMEGTPDGNFKPSGTLSRGEMCTVIIRIMDKTKRKAFNPDNGHAIILSNIYSGQRYVISRPDKKEEIKLAYILQNAKDKSKGWYYLTYNGEDISCSFYDSQESFKKSSYNVRMSLDIGVNYNENLAATYYLVVFEPKTVKGVHQEVVSEIFKHVFAKDYEKAMDIFNKYIEEGVNDTAKPSDVDYSFNNRKMNIYRSNFSGTFAIKIYKKVN